MPRIGTLNLAQIVAEVGPILERADNAEQVCAEAGVAPVTYASGHKHTVAFRVSANRHARQALTVFADNSRHADPWAARIYAAARDRGHRHPHAIRILARGWVRIIWQCWHHDRVRPRTTPGRLTTTPNSPSSAPRPSEARVRPGADPVRARSAATAPLTREAEDEQSSARGLAG